MFIFSDVVQQPAAFEAFFLDSAQKDIWDSNRKKMRKEGIC
jgi:hypothetical protein